tara:strand:+ start:222 stop:458 length:237 start_codon:yes stop_codon:yes gene_type:complete
MQSTLCYIKYELLPEYTEKSQLTNLFLEDKFLGWLGLLIIFILICSVLYFQFKIWDSEDRLAIKKSIKRKERTLKEKK